MANTRDIHVQVSLPGWVQRLAAPAYLAYVAASQGEMIVEEEWETLDMAQHHFVQLHALDREQRAMDAVVDALAARHH